MRRDLEASFSDIADPRWRCTSGDSSSESDSYLYSCDLKSGGVSGPTVNFEAFPEPEAIETTVARASEGHRELERQDHSGNESRLTLLGTEEWVPSSGGEPWGSVARWRFDSEELGHPLYSASFRYADKPFGLTVYASSDAKLEGVVASLNLPAPRELPD